MMIGVLVFATMVTTGSAGTPSSPVDPSGTYVTAWGDLSILQGQRSLAFSYLAVFGPTAHLCDGAGMAREETPGRYVWADEAGSVTFRIDGDTLHLELSGVASFCGADWPGDTASLTMRQAPSRRAVTMDKARFYTVGPGMPQLRKAYVVRGDTVEVVPTLHGNGEGFVVGRFAGPARITVGLLREEDLTPVATPQGPPEHGEAPR